MCRESALTKPDRDVTELIDFSSSNIDGELLPVRRCVCGQEFSYWEFVISIYRDNPYSCPECNRKFYFISNIRVFEVMDEGTSQ